MSHHTNHQASPEARSAAGSALLSRQRLLDAIQLDNSQPSARERLSSPKGTEAPRDYAPKDNDQPGTLAPDFGLKGKKQG